LRSSEGLAGTKKQNGGAGNDGRKHGTVALQWGNVPTHIFQSPPAFYGVVLESFAIQRTEIGDYQGSKSIHITKTRGSGEVKEQSTMTGLSAGFRRSVSVPISRSLALGRMMMIVK
jgi:hypothetical protein